MIEVTGSLYGACIHMWQLASPCIRNALAHKDIAHIQYKKGAAADHALYKTEKLDDDANGILMLHISIILCQ